MKNNSFEEPSSDFAALLNIIAQTAYSLKLDAKRILDVGCFIKCSISEHITR